MDSFSVHLILYIVSFIVVWLGSGLVVSAVAHLAKSWHLPAFTVSFFLLGLLTSLPEIAISGFAVLNNDPTISIGSLLGGIIVLFLLVIPLLGMACGNVKIPKILSQKDILFILVVVMAPFLLTTDQRLTPWEGATLLLIYCMLFLFVSKEESLAERMKKVWQLKNKKWEALLLKILVGVIMLLVASQQIIRSTIFFAATFQVPSFLLGLLVVSLGTNIPEISIIIRSVLQKRTDIALADYLGSAVANTFIAGVITLIYGKPIFLPNHFIHRFVLLGIGLVLFFFFAQSKRTISRLESLTLFGCYILFIVVELFLFPVH